MVQLSANAESTSTALLPAPCEDQHEQPVTPCLGRVRLEWNGLTGCRQVRVYTRFIADDDTGTVQREEQLIGEVSEPFS